MPLYPDAPRGASIFCKAEIEDGKLSISGVIGPLASGNALGGCGQIDMEFQHRNPQDDDTRYSSPIPAASIKYAKGWDAEKWLDFLDIWKAWHLNDMTAGCEHQEAERWGNKTIVKKTWKLTPETLSDQRKIEERTMESLKTRGRAEISDEEREILNFEYEVIAPEPPHSFYYKLEKEEQARSGHTYETEHPDGVLSKPCPVCGYKYGTEWKCRELPESVIKFIEALPEPEKVPAWV